MGRTIVVAIVAGGLALSAGGCQPQEEYGSVPPLQSASAPATSSPASAATTSPMPPARSPEDQQVVDRYLAYVRALERLYETTDPAAVDMSAVATGAQLRKVVEVALGMKGRGEFASGVLHDAPGAVRRTGDGAVLVSCQDANGLRVRNRRTGALVNPSERFPRRAQRVALVRRHGVWFVESVLNDGAC